MVKVTDPNWKEESPMNKPLLRAEAIIIRRDGAAVLVQCDRDETFYRFPGGTVEFGETAAEAISRELIEEFELRADIGPLACLNESIAQYDGKQRHDCTVLHWGTVDDSRFKNVCSTASVRTSN